MAELVLSMQTIKAVPSGPRLVAQRVEAVERCLRRRLTSRRGVQLRSSATKDTKPLPELVEPVFEVSVQTVSSQR
jgi:hypothetical protein